MGYAAKAVARGPAGYAEDVMVVGISLRLRRAMLLE
jgi:hypothetical protein